MLYNVFYVVLQLRWLLETVKYRQSTGRQPFKAVDYS